MTPQRWGRCATLKANWQASTDFPPELEAAKADCLNIAAAIYQKISALAACYRNVYQPVQRFITEHPLARDDSTCNSRRPSFRLDLRGDFSA